MHTLTFRFFPFQSLRSTFRVLLVFVCWCLALSTNAATLTVENVSVGYDSLFRVGRFTQVAIEVDSDQATDDVRLELELLDGEGVRSVVVRDGLTLQAGSNSLRAVAKFGRVQSDLTVRLLADSKLLAEKTLSAKAMLASQNLVLTLGPDVAVGDAISLRQEKKEQESIHALVKDASSLPSEWLGYDGVSLVVLACGSRSMVGSMSEPQLAALDQWIRLGGRMIFSGGVNAETFLASDGPLARFLPGAFDRVTMQRQTSGIENYVGKTEKSLSSFVGEGDLAFNMPMALLKKPRGVAIVSEGIGQERTPLVIRASHGFGHVIFVASDLDDAPLSSWKDGRRRLVGKLVDVALGTTQRDDSDRKYSRLTQIGFEDLTGQLRAALDQFSAVTLVPFSWIALLIGGYILLIGPVDYFLLRKLKQRFSWTWLTFPLVVLAASVLAFSLTKHWKGRAFHMNQVDIVDFDSVSGLTRTMTWAHVFSPASRKYDIAAKPTEELFPINAPRGSIATWQGLAGNSFGGMNTSRANQSKATYEIVSDPTGEQQVQVKQMPVDVYASRSLSGLTWGQVDFPELPKLTADIEDQLEGEVRNPLPVDLKDSVLCFGRLAYPLGTLPAGGPTIIDRFGAKKISSRLTRWRVELGAKGQGKGKSIAWDRNGLDLERILEIMMFHDAAGGGNYTSLLNRLQSEVDFSDHLEQGTALLIGKIEHRPTEMFPDADLNASTNQNQDGNTEENSKSDSGVTFVRILIPVTKKTRNKNAGT